MIWPRDQTHLLYNIHINNMLKNKKKVMNYIYIYSNIKTQLNLSKFNTKSKCIGVLLVNEFVLDNMHNIYPCHIFLDKGTV